MKKLVILIILLAHFKIYMCKNEIPCPVTWTLFYRGGNFPVTAVPTDLSIFNSTHRPKVDSLLFIARVKRPGGHFDIVSVNRNLNNLTFNSDQYSLEILTNPNNCTLRRVSTQEKILPLKFLVKSNEKSSLLFLGGEKLTLKNNGIEKPKIRWLPCNLKTSSLSCRSTKAGRKQENIHTSLYFLKSFITPKLRVTLFDMVFLNQTSHLSNSTLVGCDKIHNKASDGSISQIVTHFSETSNRVTFKLGATIDAGIDAQIEVELAAVSFGVKMFYGSLSGHLGLDLGVEAGLDYTRETKILDSSTQRVSVPPKTMVEVCTNSVVKTVNISFEAKARIQHDFLSWKEVMTLLEHDKRFVRPFKLVDRKSNTIESRILGEMKNIDAFATELVVNPLNYLGTKKLH